jgi:hypothetical protein
MTRRNFFSGMEALQEESVEISSVSEFVEKITHSMFPDNEYPVAFRGHRDSSWKLIPKALREDTFAKNEHRLLRDLIASHPQEFALLCSTSTKH